MEQFKKYLTEISSIDAYNKFYKNVFNSDENKDKEIYDKIIELDPTYNKEKDILGNYTKWLLRKDNIEILKKTKDEDLYKIKDDLSFFDKGKKINLFPVDKKDINKFNIDTLLDFVFIYNKNNQGLTSKSEKEKEIKKDIIRYDLSNWLIIIPKTEEASCYYGKGTKWCTAATGYNNQFDNYNKKGNLYILINKNDPSKKYQFHFKSLEFQDEKARNINLLYFFEENDDLIDFFKNEIGDDLYYNLSLSAIKNNDIDSFYNYYSDDFTYNEKYNLINEIFNQASEEFFSALDLLDEIKYINFKKDFYRNIIDTLGYLFRYRYVEDEIIYIKNLINKIGGINEETIDDIMKEIEIKDKDQIKILFDIVKDFNAIDILNNYFEENGIDENIGKIIKKTNYLENLKKTFNYNESEDSYESNIAKIKILDFGSNNDIIEIELIPKDNNGNLLIDKKRRGNIKYENIVNYLQSPSFFNENKKQKKRDILKGGLSDKKTLKDIAKSFKVPLLDLFKQFIEGIKIEKEHTNDFAIASEIAKDHLSENPNYYKLIKKYVEK
jgi:hypothetical protein